MLHELIWDAHYVVQVALDIQMQRCDIFESARYLGNHLEHDPCLMQCLEF